jgi:hypothetical protein
LNVTEEDKEEHFSGIAMNVGDEIVHGAPDYIREATEFPDYKPHFEFIKVDHEGCILVATCETSPEGDVYDVFDPEARFVNRVTLTREFSSCAIATGCLYRLDVKDKEASVVRHRLE